jgi:hypothetical protein
MIEGAMTTETFAWYIREVRRRRWPDGEMP